MKPERALELVQSYAALNRKMKEHKKTIAYNLEQCRGVNGDRKDENGYFFSDEKYNDTHLNLWFKWDKDEDSSYGAKIQYNSPDQDECPYCWIAYLEICERKETHKKFGIIKAIISRMG